MKLEHPKTLKQLRSFMGSIHHLIKLIPKLAELTEPLRPLLKKTGNKNNRLNWNETHSKTFTNIKQKDKTNYRKQTFHYNERNTHQMRCQQKRPAGKYRTKTQQRMAYNRFC